MRKRARTGRRAGEEDTPDSEASSEPPRTVHAGARTGKGLPTTTYSPNGDPAAARAAEEFVVPPQPREPFARIIPLGGCGEIGRNMTLVETNDDLVAVDCGLMFPDDEMLGVDIVINDFTYLRERADKFRALLVTHGHEDHIGGIPYLLREFKVPVIGTALTLALIRAKMRENKADGIELTTVQPGERVRHGSIETQFVHSGHQTF